MRKVLNDNEITTTLSASLRLSLPIRFLRKRGLSWSVYPLPNNYRTDEPQDTDYNG